MLFRSKAQANLIQRREETAATRSLLNTARLLEENPVLLSTSQLIGVGMFCLGLGLFFRWRPKELPKADGGLPGAAAAAA